MKYKARVRSGMGYAAGSCPAFLGVVWGGFQVRERTGGLALVGEVGRVGRRAFHPVRLCGRWWQKRVGGGWRVGIGGGLVVWNEWAAGIG